MWRRNWLITASGLILTALNPSFAKEPASADLLISDADWVRFDVTMGRLLATTIRTKQDRQQARRNLPGGATESLAVSIDRGLISLRYAWDCDSWQIALRVVRGDDVEVRWTRRESNDAPLTSVYVQRPGEDVSLSVAAGEGPARAYRAPSLWHLAIAHPGVCEQHLWGVLRLVCPDWTFADKANEVRAMLMNASSWEADTSLAEVKLLVAQLSHKSFRVRQQADRELQSRGPRLLGLLDELDYRELEAEQRLRIKEIRRAVTGDASDTPPRVANWLANDKRLWLVLIDDDDPQLRLAAGRQLSRIFQQQVDFDPHAEPPVRGRQVAAIRDQILRR